MLLGVLYHVTYLYLRGYGACCTGAEAGGPGEAAVLKALGGRRSGSLGRCGQLHHLWRPGRLLHVVGRLPPIPSNNDMLSATQQATVCTTTFIVLLKALMKDELCDSNGIVLW